MTDLSRRHLLTTAAALGAAAAVGPVSTAHAAAPPAGKQAPGFYRYKVGDIEVTVVTDGLNQFPLPDNFVVNMKKEEVQAGLAAAYMDKNIFFNPYNPIVINTGSKLVLVDTGTGEGAFNQSKGKIGQLQTNLVAAGFDPKAFDAVIISHYHGDHINGLIKADNTVAFPNAEILVPAKEHGFWMDDGEMSRASKGRMETNFKNVRRVFNDDVKKRVRTYEWDKDVVAGVKAIGTPGHSTGHTSFVVSSGNGKVFVQSDMTHVPFLFVRNPGWHALYDQDPVAAEATRRKMLDMLAAERMMVQGFHFPFPSHGYIEKSGNSYREVMAAWNPSI
jgi:glyoxylase-like metal-dependent hydrolase (beta-lactamase superfamily II)